VIDGNSNSCPFQLTSMSTIFIFGIDRSIDGSTDRRFDRSINELSQTSIHALMFSWPLWAGSVDPIASHRVESKALVAQSPNPPPHPHTPHTGSGTTRQSKHHLPRPQQRPRQMSPYACMYAVFSFFSRIKFPSGFTESHCLARDWPPLFGFLRLRGCVRVLFDDRLRVAKAC
jgi:hypothetical protein